VADEAGAGRGFAAAQEAQKAAGRGQVQQGERVGNGSEAQRALPPRAPMAEGGEPVEDDLGGQGRPVEGAPPGEGGAGHRQHHQAPGYREARQLVGDELPQEPIAEGIEQGGTEREELVVSRQGADLAAVLAGRALGDAVPGPGLRCEEHAMAREHHLHGHRHVVEDRARIEAGEEGLPHRVQRSRDPHRGVEPALRVAHCLLVAPVESDPPGGSPRGRDQVQLAAHRAHRGVRETGHQLAHGVPGQGLSRVGEDQDLAPRDRHRLVEGGRLAAGPRQGEQPYPLRREAGRDGFRAVGGAVGGDDHLEPFPRVIEVEHVAELLLEAGLFVPHHGEQAHGRRGVPLADLRGRSQARGQEDQRGIAEVRVEDDRGGEPERDLHRGTLTQARGAPPGFDPGPPGRYAFQRPLTCTAAGE